MTSCSHSRPSSTSKKWQAKLNALSASRRNVLSGALGVSIGLGFSKLVLDQSPVDIARRLSHLVPFNSANPQDFRFRPYLLTPPGQQPTSAEADATNAAIAVVNDHLHNQALQNLRFEPATVLRSVTIDGPDSIYVDKERRYANAMEHQVPFVPDGTAFMGIRIANQQLPFALAGAAQVFSPVSFALATEGADELLASYAHPTSSVGLHSLAATMLHEAIHAMGFHDHVAEPSDIMYASELNGGEPPSSGNLHTSQPYYQEVVRKSPYMTGPPRVQHRMDRVWSSLRGAGHSLGNVETGTYVVLTGNSNSVLQEGGFVQKFADGAVIDFEERTFPIFGPLYERWKQLGAEDNAGLPTGPATVTPMGRDRSLATLQLTSGVLSEFVTPELARTIEQSAGLNR